MNDELLQSLDWLVVRCDFENRAEAIRAALEAFADAERQRQIGEQIVAGYERIPETAQEVDWARLTTFDGLPDDDWGDWI